MTDLGNKLIHVLTQHPPDSPHHLPKTDKRQKQAENIEDEHESLSGEDETALHDVPVN